MEKILRTDNAYQAIDKINANFKEANTGGELAQYEGSFVGNGDTFVYAYFPAKAGDYMHLEFPGGTWDTKSSRENYNKLIWGYRDNSNALHNLAELAREPWPIPSYGFDLYLSDVSTDVKDAFIAVRAVSGNSVNFKVTWLSKTEMKSYFADEMADTVNKVRERQKNACLTLALCTDIHYRDIQEQYRPFGPYVAPGMTICMKELARRVRLDNVVCMGDAIDGLWTAARAKMDARDIAKDFSAIGVPLLYSMGNHDDNRYWNNEGGDRRLTEQEMYGEFIQQVDERAVLGAMNGCNHYRDVDRAGIRLIVLMSNNFSGQYGYTNETQTWLTNTIASMPNDYKAIIITHAPPVASHNWSGTGYTGGGAIETIITNNKSKVLCLFEGHTHIDNVYVSPWPAVNICCQKVYNSENGLNNLGSSAPEDAWWPVRAVGDYREVLWDAVVVDQTNSLLSCIRFGAGVDRYIHLAPVSCSAGGTVTLTPSVITATTWHAKTSESESVSVDSSGVVTVESGVTSGTQLTIRAADADGNFEYWAIKVS